MNIPVSKLQEIFAQLPAATTYPNRFCHTLVQPLISVTADAGTPIPEPIELVFESVPNPKSTSKYDAMHWELEFPQ